MNDKKSEKHDKTEEIEIDGGAEIGASSGIYCLSIIGQIEGHYVLDSNQKTTKYDHIIPLLVSLEENPRINGILIVLNTLGGDVEAGLAIAELIASLSTPTASIYANGIYCVRWRPFYRGSARGKRRQVVYCSQRNDDSSSGQDERPGAWSSTSF